MDPTNLGIADPNGTLRYFINANEQSLRIVVKRQGESEFFQLSHYGSKLDNAFITDNITVYQKINTFLTENADRFNQTLVTDYSGIIDRKLAQINSLRTGFFAFIILFFNRSRRRQINAEYQAVAQIQTTLQGLRGMPPARSDVNPRAVPSDASAAGSTPGTAGAATSPSTTNIPPPPPPPPPPVTRIDPFAAVAAGRAANNQLPIPPTPAFHNEPERPVFEGSEKTREQIEECKNYGRQYRRAFEAIQTRMDGAAGEIQQRTLRAAHCRTRISGLEEEIERLQSKIQQNEQTLNFLQQEHEGDVFHITYRAANDGKETQLPILTHQGYAQLQGMLPGFNSTAAASSTPVLTDEPQADASHGPQEDEATIDPENSSQEDHDTPAPSDDPSRHEQFRAFRGELQGHVQIQMSLPPRPGVASEKSTKLNLQSLLSTLNQPHMIATCTAVREGYLRNLESLNVQLRTVQAEQTQIMADIETRKENFQQSFGIAFDQKDEYLAQRRSFYDTCHARVQTWEATLRRRESSTAPATSGHQVVETAQGIPVELQDHRAVQVFAGALEALNPEDPAGLGFKESMDFRNHFMILRKGIQSLDENDDLISKFILPPIEAN